MRDGSAVNVYAMILRIVLIEEGRSLPKQVEKKVDLRKPVMPV